MWSHHTYVMGRAIWGNFRYVRHTVLYLTSLYCPWTVLGHDSFCLSDDVDQISIYYEGDKVTSSNVRAWLTQMSQSWGNWWVVCKHHSASSKYCLWHPPNRACHRLSGPIQLTHISMALYPLPHPSTVALYSMIVKTTQMEDCEAAPSCVC